MSMTFSFSGDERTSTNYACDCAAEGVNANNHCRECKGTGIVRFMTDAHCFNLSNGSALRLQELVGMTPDYCGTIAASWAMHHDLKRRMEGMFESGDRNLLSCLKTLVVDAIALGANEISFG